MNLSLFLKPNLSKIIIFIILFFLSIVIPWLIFGTTSFYFVIAGDGMAPEYNRYDRVFLKKTDFNDLKTNNVIVFSDKERRTIIGRIISIDYNKGLFTAKQDKGDKPFPYETELSSNFVKGKVLGKAPYLFNLLYGNFLIRLIILYLSSCFISSGIKKIKK